MGLILENIAFYVKEKIDIKNISLDNYISTENMIPNKGGISKANSLPNTKKVTRYQMNDILISNIRPYFKKIWFASRDGGCSNDVLVIRSKNSNISKFIYYVLSTNEFFDYVMSNSKGTKMPRGDKNSIMKFKIPEINFENQVKICNILENLDQKIEINKVINQNLYFNIRNIQLSRHQFW